MRGRIGSPLSLILCVHELARVERGLGVCGFYAFFELSAQN